MPRLTTLIPAVIITAVIALPQFSFAADGKANAVTDLKDVDDDFPIQGEYLGAVRDASGCCRHVGVQVVALGNGEFSAMSYEGGLPGYGFTAGGNRARFTGKRAGDQVVLTGEKQSLAIGNGYLVIRDAGDPACSIGSARRVHRASPTLGACPPCNAVVLFDGSHVDHFEGGRMTDAGHLMEGTQTKGAYGDFRLHVEFKLPYMPTARGQGRSNSGCYLQSRYEVQILDSFGLEGEHNECGGLYRQRKPDVNMCLPPLSWQTYDIWLKSAEFDTSGEKPKKTKNARITVWHNGVAIHDDVELKNKTGAGRPEGPNRLPTKLQNHGNPVRFRNIWLVSYDSADSGSDVDRVAARIPGDPELAALFRVIGYKPKAE